MTDSALMVRGEMPLSDTMTLGKTLAESGYFDDAKQAAQAVVKILAGRELGLGPIASMTGIHIIKKKITLGANLMAATVKRDPRYDYRVIEMADSACEIVFFEQGAEIGRSRFTAQDAQRAGTQNMNKFPRNMLFARAMSNGVKWYCPDAFGGGPVYTPEEMGATVDGDGGIIDMPPAPQPPRDEDPFDSLRDVDHEADNAEAKREIEGLELEPRTPHTAARMWPKATIDAIVDANLARPAKHAVKMLNLSTKLVTTDDVALVLEWANRYRGHREDGKEPEQAAKLADDSLEGITPAEESE